MDPFSRVVLRRSRRSVDDPVVAFVSMTCGRCGRVEVPLSAVVLSVDDVTAAARCIMRCPSCRVRMVRNTDEAMTLALEMVGAAVTPWDTTAPERVDAVHTPLTAADLESFRERLHLAEPADFLPWS
jgi:hypothetical protein